MWFERLLPPQIQRERALRRSPAGPLRDYLCVPFPNRRSDIRELTFLSVDFETTGLDIGRDHILSVGMVEVTSEGIDLASARHLLVRSARELPAQSVTIHRLTDDQIAGGIPIGEAISRLLEELAGKVLLAHNARIECGFIRRACADIFGGDWLAPLVDTAHLGRRTLARSGTFHHGGQISLDRLRAAHRLPSYQAHNALADAIATGELFLAQTAHLRGNHGVLRLREIGG